MEYIAQGELKQVGIKQDISFNSGLDQKTILGLGERISGGNWFSFVTAFAWLDSSDTDRDLLLQDLQIVWSLADPNLIWLSN